jgi:hypothetical protein
MNRIPDEFIPEEPAVLGEADDLMAMFEKGDRVLLGLKTGRGETTETPATAVYRGYVVPETGNEAPAGIGDFELLTGDHIRVHFCDRSATLKRDNSLASLPHGTQIRSIKLLNGWSQ